MAATFMYTIRPCLRTHVACASLSLSIFMASAAHEHHPEHPVVHATALWKIPKRRQNSPTSFDAIGIDGIEQFVETQGKEEGDGDNLDDNEEWERIINLTTQLSDQKSEYTGAIGVGTDKNGKALFHANVVFDTGSTNLWVASVLCDSGPCSDDRSKEFYDPHKSLTEESYDGRKGDIDIMFGTGELKGPLHVDTYRVGPMVVKGQPFAMIREMTGEVFSSFPFEGILGLAFKSLSFGGITPFFERVIDQKVLGNNEFAFYLNTDSSKPSALLWGGVDKDLFEGPIVMFPVVQPHYWSLELVEFRVGDEVFGGTRHDDSNLKRVIVDSGTTYFTTPRGIYNNVLAHMKEAACKDVESYQPMTYVLKGVNGDTFELVVTQETYMVGVAGNEETCRPAFMPLDVNPKYGPALILGEVFMRHFFTVFSRGGGGDDEARIGLAQAKIGANVKVEATRDQHEEQYDNKQFLAEHIPDGAHGMGPVLAEQEVLEGPPQTQNGSEMPQKHRDHVRSLMTPRGAHRYKGLLFGLRLDPRERDRSKKRVAGKAAEAHTRQASVSAHNARTTLLANGDSPVASRAGLETKGLLRREDP